MRRRSFLSLFGLAAVPQSALAQPRAIMEPSRGWGWDLMDWVRKLIPSTVGTAPRVDFVMDVRGDALYRISPAPSPVESAGVMFDCVAPAGILLQRGSQITGHFQGLADGALVRLEMHCVQLAE